jgi:hypothetical protein
MNIQVLNLLDMNLQAMNPLYETIGLLRKAGSPQVSYIATAIPW